MTTKKSYSYDSVQRGLTHHELTGALERVSPPGVGQPKWRVVVFGQPELLSLSLREAWILCMGLAAGERNTTRRVETLR